MFQRIRAALRRRHQFWEGLCTQCGLCCYERRVRRGKVEILWNRPCEYLNTEDHRCTVYPRRFQMCRYCGKVTIFHALFSRSLPETCGYVRYYRSGRGRVSETSSRLPNREVRQP